MKCGKWLLTAAVLLFLGGSAAWADMGHGGPGFSFGSPGTEAEVTKTIRVEARDDMTLAFDREDIQRGDVVKFIIINRGKIRHEFSIGDAAYQRAHAAEMMKHPGMVHDEPHSATLEPGTSKTLIWKFDAASLSEVVFSCNEPGHFAAGMARRIKLSPL
jgi:uncharacterized cupredoxin-like copper-binding protein